MAPPFRQRNPSHLLSSRCPGRLDFTTRRCIFTQGAASWAHGYCQRFARRDPKRALSHIRRFAHPHLPGTVFPPSTAPCDDLFLLILHKDDGSSKRRAKLHSTMKETREFGGRKRGVGPLSLSLLVRVFMHLQICSQPTRRGEVLELAPR